MLVNLESVITCHTCLCACDAHAPLSCSICTSCLTVGLTLPVLSVALFTYDSQVLRSSMHRDATSTFGMIGSLVVVYLVNENALDALLPSSLLESTLNLFTHFEPNHFLLKCYLIFYV